MTPTVVVKRGLRNQVHTCSCKMGGGCGIKYVVVKWGGVTESGSCKIGHIVGSYKIGGAQIGGRSTSGQVERKCTRLRD